MKKPLAILALLSLPPLLLAAPVNLAVRGAASGSTEGFGAVFADANDGNRDGQFYTGSVFHTALPDTTAFWEVDLGETFYLDHIRIYPRTDELQGSVVNFRIRVFDGASNQVFSRSFLPTAAANNAWGTAGVRGVAGRRVRIERMSASPQWMTFAEFEVWGDSVPPGTNLARGKPVTSSSSASGGVAEHGNDGDIDGDYNHSGNPIYHSGIAAPGQFWQVDLQSTNEIDRLGIFLRTDFNNTSLVRLRVLDGALRPIYTATQNISTAIFELGARRFAVTHRPPAGTFGRHVRIETLNSEYLTFGEVEVFGVPPEFTPPGAFFGTGTTWKLLRGRSEASTPDATAWRQPTFDDSSWSNAPAPFLYTTAPNEPPFWDGGPFRGTLLNDMLNTYSCVFLRKTFVVTNTSRLARLDLAAASDDGFIAWLNGVEVARRNMPLSPIAFNRFASLPVTEPTAVTTNAIPVATGLVSLETNVLAVQAFNAALSSSDFGFMAMLAAVRDERPPLLTEQVPSPGEVVAQLTEIEVAFDEPVIGLEAADLLVSGLPATGLIPIGPGGYRFTFAQPAEGTVIVSFAVGHGITDEVGNGFAGGSWQYILSTNFPPARAIITEFLADNRGGLTDEDGDSEDWIEIYNPGPLRVNLRGWYLSDASNILAKWRFPATNLATEAFMIVFASGKNRTNAGPLHTNFRLDADGGYLALVRPDGASIASEFHYGNQRENFSFGLGRALSPTPLLASTSAVRVLIPPDDSVGMNWTGGAEPFDDSAWRAGSMGVGFDQSTGPAASLLAWWDFNNASNSTVALDASGRGHNGAIVTATFTANGGGRTGLPGDRAMNFAGAGYVQIPDAATGLFDTALSNDAVTLSLWIYGDASQPQPGGVFYGSSQSVAAGDRSLNAHLPWTDSVIYWDTGCCESTQHRVGVGEPDPAKWRGRWNHYAFVKNGDIKEIWQNGVRILDGINTANLLPVRSFYIGTYAPGALTYRGRIDDFAVWDTALGAQEIETLALGQTPLNVQRLTRFITTDVGAAMRGVNASAWVRAAFVRNDSAIPDVLLLRARYDDGFIAYLNGTEIARRNAPPTPAFNAAATAKRPAGAAMVPEEIDVSRFASALRPGTNVLAFHALNASASEAEFLIQAELVAGQLIPNRFFAEPTPGQTNTAGTAGFVADTKFSIDRGFCAVPFMTGITCATAGATIVFTRDGSEPSLANGTAVAAPDAATGPFAIVNITNTTVLRAAAFKPDYHPANIDTHTYLFPARVAAQRRPSGVGPAWPDGAPADFEIDPRIVAGALPGYSFTNALLSIPTLSLVTPQEGLFGSGRGIYAHSEGRGDEWERAVSAEWMYPDGREGFQVNAGLRIHGNISRQNSFTPKHSFSLFFRGRYGPTKLEFPLFPGSPVREFDMLVLRGGSTDTWPCTEWNTFFVDGVLRWNRAEASYVRDQWVRDAQIAMGQPSSHGAFAHLYLNGLYWGIYNVCERPDEDFNATHVGGQDTDYDVIFDFGEVQAGSKDTWNQMNGMSGGLANDANYMRLLGNDPDGARNTNFPVLLDVTNLVDYMIVHIFIGADDWPNHNWWAARHRGPDSTGFKFFAWDQEISISSLIRQHSSWGPIYAEVNAPDTPAQIYSGLRQNAEFRVFFGDRVYHRLFNDGALSVSNNLARWDMRMTEIDRAVVAESARWGDYQRPAQPYRREVEWLASNQWMRATFWPSNHHVALRRFRDAGLYPSINPPTVSQFGGGVPAGFSVSLANPNNSGAILFTADGSDPRLRGGAVSARAQSYALPITINQRTVLRARVKDGPAWSALAEATFHTPQDFSALQLSELHYNPPMFQQIDGDDYEFLELRNTGAVPLDLSNVAFTQGLAFTFPNGTRIAAGGFLILARNPPRFAARFELPPGIAVVGPYSARLDNGGETITLTHPLGDTIFSLRYDDRAPWPEGADGPGPSLHRVNNLAAANPTNWAAATPTPGAPPPAEIVDTDGDGMPDLWESAHGLQPLTNDAAADADFDGLSNLAEYLAGTDPTDPDSGLRITSVQLADGGASVVLTFHASAGRNYTIQWCATLDAGEWLPILNLQALPEPGSMTVTNSVPSSGTSFFRLAVP